jgi:4,5-dihydroxyphthalate decarboxylase
MKKINLTIATSDYDHFRDFRSGEVQAQGIEPIWLQHEIHEIFSRFAAKREWDVSEMSFAKFTAQFAEGETSDVIALPVFASRVFRLSSLYVNPSKGIRTAADLKGKRVGLPEWAQTAAVYTRGWLEHEAGVPLTSIQWVQAGTEDAGRTEKVDLTLPKGINIIREPEKTLSDMIVRGELDAIMTATIPLPYQRRDPNIKRLFDDPRAEEVKYFQRTGVYPIMHIIAMRKAVLEEHPWVARNLYLAFLESKDRAMARIFEGGVSRYPIPWLNDTVMELRDLFKGDIYPYGVDTNYTTLETFLRFCFEQGVAKKLLKPEDIFPAGINPQVKT